MLLTYAGRQHRFGSQRLAEFLALLREAHPSWVDFATLSRQLPGLSPRQLARFVNRLDAAGLPLVVATTKTRGPFCLAVAPETLGLPAWCGRAVVGRPMAAAEALPAPAHLPLDALVREAWVDWAIALLQARIRQRRGSDNGFADCLALLATAEAAASQLPPLAGDVVRVRHAQVLARAGRHREAGFALRRVNTAVRAGLADPLVRAAACQIRAKSHYDRNQLVEAERLAIAAPPDPPTPQSLNLQALLAGRGALQAGPEAASGLLAQALSLLIRALASVLLGYGDDGLLDALSFNFANNLDRCLELGMLPANAGDTVLAWLAANAAICRELGVGGDSVLAELKVVEASQRYGRWPTRWPAGVVMPAGPRQLLVEAEAKARRSGNALEIAECLRLRACLTANATSARLLYFEAMDLLREFDRRDIAESLKAEWQQRFGSVPTGRR